MLFKLLCLLGCSVIMTRARCDLTAEPLELIDCLSHLSTIMLGLAKNDINRMCRSTALIAQCAQGHLSECIGQQIGNAAFNEIKNLTLNCCPDRNSPNCPIRDSVIRDQRCFAADSLVTLANGQQKIIAHLQSHDSLLAYRDGNKQVVSTSLLTMLDFQPHRFALFKEVRTVTGRQLSLTSSHLLLTEEQGYLMAKNVQAGMHIYVVGDKGALVTERVSNVTDVVKQGYVAPLTDEGTVVVNGVAASCYATISSHQVAHAVLSPLRWWYGVFGASWEDSSTEVMGVHWFAKMLYEVAAFLVPSVIHY